MPLYAYSKPVPVPPGLGGGDYLVSLSVQRVDGEPLAPAELRRIRAVLAASTALDAPALAKPTSKQASPAKSGRMAE